MIEWIAPGFVYSVIKDAWGAFRGRRRALTPAQILELRQKWKPLFDNEIWKTHNEKLRKDVIVRDVKRLDSYPVVDRNAKGISPWFRASLLATYHRGIFIGLRWGELTQDESGEWRYTNYDAGEKGDLKVVLIGQVPFENIEAVDWNGDEYYYYPHIYCYFDAKKKEPYENLVFCVEKSNSYGTNYYVDIASLEQVRQASKKLGTHPS